MNNRFSVLFKQILDLDFLTTVGFRLSATGTGFLTSLLIVHYLSPEEQGYWYTFSSILGLAAFAEMGAGQILLRFVAKEQPQLDHSEEARIRLSNLFFFGGKLSAILSTGVSLIALLVGFWWLPQTGEVGVDWKTAWLLAAVISGPTLFVGFANSFFEGMQLVTAANVRRVLSAWIALASMALAFVSGLGLVAYALSRLVSNAYSILHLYLANKGRIKMLYALRAKPKIFNGREEFLPLQYKYALTWATGIFVNGLYAPLIFKFDGVIAAGEYGLSFGFLGIISGISGSLLVARRARMAALAGNGDYEGVIGNFRKILLIGVVTFTSASLVLVALVQLNPSFINTYTSRMLSPSQMGLLALSQLLWLLVTIFTTTVRSFNIEPFIKLAWIHALFSASLCIPAAIYLKVDGVLLIAALGNLFSAVVSYNILKNNFHLK